MMAGEGFWVYTPVGGPQSAWRPTVSSVTANTDGSFTLTGTQLNGRSYGSVYGDDNMMATNFPIVSLTDGAGHVFYARSFGFSTRALFTGSTPVSCQFKLPANMPNGTYNLFRQRQRDLVGDGVSVHRGEQSRSNRGRDCDRDRHSVQHDIGDAGQSLRQFDDQHELQQVVRHLCAEHVGTGLHGLRFAGTTSFAITSTITTANDTPTRDPRDWTLQGCQGTCAAASDTGWVTLDTRTGQFAGAARFQTNTYSFSNTTAFQQYRLRITANNGATLTQIAEIQMFGAPPSSSSDVTEGGTVAATGTPCNTTSETPDKAYDNLMTSTSFSKWCVSSVPTTSVPVSTLYDFAGTTAFAVTRYTITAGNDVRTRSAGLGLARMPGNVRGRIGFRVGDAR